MDERNPPPEPDKENDVAWDWTNDVPEAGYPKSVHKAVNIAAPLLAAAAVTLTGVVAADEIEFRWPAVAMLCLVLATVALVASIQLGFRARRYMFTREELEEWFAGTPRLAEYFKEAHNQDRALAIARNTWDNKVASAVYTYNIGTVLLGLGLAAVLLPKSDSEQPGVRWAAMVVTLVATLGELIWSWALTVPHTKAKRPPDEARSGTAELGKVPGGSGPGSGISIDGSGHRDA
jgi:hypothetical protein